MSLVCVPILVHDFELALADAREAKAGGADMVELRVDAMASFDDAAIAAIEELIASCPLPCVLTCRVAAEGGGYDGEDADRISLFERLTEASVHPPTYLDVEWSSFSRSADLAQRVRVCVDHEGALRTQSTRLILSTHDMGARPADLSRRVSGMACERACAVIKAAWRARSLHDAIEALEWCGQAGKPSIMVAIGEFGVMSRVLAPKFGGFLSFAPLRSTEATAPGQATLSELLNTYRFRSIGARTGVYGVVGYPVGHSLSPLVHNAGFREVGHDGAYVPMPIATYTEAETTYAGFRAAVLELIEHPRMDFRGASVTMPHKENLARLAMERGWERDGATRDIGAANTLTVLRDGSGEVRVRVSNTDVPAVHAEVEAAVGTLIRKEQGGSAPLRVGVIGAGGMGKSAAYACAQAGAQVVLYNRDAERARRVAREIEPFARYGGKVIPAAMHLLPRACCNVFIQCTPLGLAGSGLEKLSALPIHDMHACPRGVVVIDTVYNPLETPTLMAAREKRWGAVDGLGLFVRQAALQAAEWTGRGTEELRSLYEKVARAHVSSARARKD